MRPFSILMLSLVVVAFGPAGEFTVERPPHLVSLRIVPAAQNATVTPLFVAPERSRQRVLYAEEPDWDSAYIAPFVPTPQEVVDRMLELAEIRKGDVLYDLGSGDGRIVITAARRYGVRAVGFEIDPGLVKDSRESIKEGGLEGLAEIREQDIRTVDFSAASVVTMYLYPAANLRLRPALMRQLKPGSRVVSHDFGMGSWQPDRVERLKDSAGLLRTIYLWRIGDRSKRSRGEE